VTPDGNAATSEGILVYTSASRFATVLGSATIGDKIRIAAANISEYRLTSAQYDNTITQLTNAAVVTLLEKKPAAKKVWEVVTPKELGGADMPTKITWDGKEFDMDAAKVIVDANNDKLDVRCVTYYSFFFFFFGDHDCFTFKLLTKILLFVCSLFFVFFFQPWSRLLGIR
jgi:hypothetical protein